MKALSIRNLRSISDSGYIELKPLTIVLGTNSSGKSTFLRTFPLLKQSISVKTESPVLWYGNYVDFGEFSDVISDQNSDGNVVLSFKFQTTANLIKQQSGHLWKKNNKNKSFNNSFDFDVSISLGEHAGDRTALKKIEIIFGGETIELILDEPMFVSRIIKNGIEYWHETKKIEVLHL